jgi:hypothetical protein
MRRPLKFFLTLIVLLLVLYLSRHLIFAKAVEGYLSHLSKEKFEYQKKFWDEGNLIYQGVILGEELHAPELKFTPEIQFFPLHLSLEVYFTQPKFKLSSKVQTPFNAAFLAPTKWTQVRLDIEKGTLFIDDEPLGSIDLVSSPEPSMLGTLILSEEEGSPYCTCELSHRENDLSFKLTCEEAPALHLHSFMNFLKITPPFQLQGGRLDADLSGSLRSIQGSMRATDLQVATEQGEFDFKRLQLKGEWEKEFSLEGAIEGGRFTSGALVIDEAAAHFTARPNIPTALHLAGRLAIGNIQGPFTCEAEGKMGQFQFEGLDIPFSVSQESAATIVNANIQHLPLVWLRQIFPFEEGEGSAQTTAIFEKSELKTVQLKNLELAWVKIKDFTCNSIQGEATIKGTTQIEQASLKIENASYGSILRKGHGAINLAANQFLSSELEAEFYEYPGKIRWQGPIEEMTGECEAFSETITFKTLGWTGTFEAPHLTLSHYSPLFPEGYVKLKGLFNPTEIVLSCIGTDVVFQRENQLVQIPGRSTPLELRWSYDQSYCAKMSIPASILHIKTIPTPIYLEGGEATYDSKQDQLTVSDMVGVITVFQKELGFKLPQLNHQRDHTKFSLEVPEEKILAVGEIKDQILTLSKAKMGSSHITAPLRATLQEGLWKVQGSAKLVLEELPFNGLQGTAHVSGWMTEAAASLDLASSGITIDTISLPPLKGHIQRDKNCFRSDNLVIGEAHLTGVAIYESKTWTVSEWTARYKDFDMQGSLRLENNICALKTVGTWKESDIQGEITWDLKTQQGSRAHLALQRGDLKVGLAAAALQWQDGKLVASEVQSTASHPILNESIIAPVSMSWTEGCLLFQGPLSQGAYENELFKLKAQSIQALYENGVLHFQTKLSLNETPLKAKGHFKENGEGAVKIDELQLTLQSFTEVTHIEGKLFGVDCSLNKKGTLYEGRIKIETSDPLATLLKKPEWTQFANIEFEGQMTPSSFKGSVSGRDVTLFGYELNELEAAVDYQPTQFEVRQLKIDDTAGQLTVKECRAQRSHPLKAWEFSIPHLRAQQLQPSLLRKIGTPPPEPKPFQIRQLTLTDITGIVGRPLTLQGKGSLYFIQKEKRDPSLFDLPRAFLKDWGLDVALLSPARGSVAVELAQGKIKICSIKDTFSDGDHSEFYLADNEPSYINFDGGLFLNLRMKQNVVLRLAEPFTLSVRGTWQQPLYTLR